MVYSSGKICVQENERTDAICAECVTEYPCYTDQFDEETTLLAASFDDQSEETELQDIIKSFVMFIK